MNKFESGDMDWLKGILNGQADNLLSHGRTERIVTHIEELEGQLAEAKEFSERCALTPIGEAMKQLAELTDRYEDLIVESCQICNDGSCKHCNAARRINREKQDAGT